MEPREYATLHALEDHFWWYGGLHRLALERAEEAVRKAPESRRREPSRPPARGGPGLTILDAGCGTGGMLRGLAARFPDAQLHGVDTSPEALRFARPSDAAVPRPGAGAPEAGRRGTGGREGGGSFPPAGGARLGRASVEQLPYADGTFDLVVSLDVLYHAAVADDVAAMRELGRVLRPGGALLLNLPAFESLRSSHDRAIHTARRYRRNELAEKLRRAGLTPVRVHYWNSLLFPALALVRWIRRRDLGPEAAAPPSDVRPLPRWIDGALSAVLACERAWLRIGPLPFGLSLMARAERPAEAPKR